MAYYSEYPGQVSGSPNNTEYLQEQVNRISRDLHQYARQQGIVLEDGPVCYDSYYQGHPYVVPTCQICGVHGHTPAECQRGNHYHPDCFGMSFAQQHSSCQSNYSYGRPEYPNLTYGNNNPQFSSFSSSAPLQDFGYAENNFYAAQTHYFAHSDVPQHQELFQEEEPSALDKTIEKLKLMLSEYSDTDSGGELNTVETSQFPQVQMFATSDHLDLNASLSQTAAHEPQHQCREPVPMELNVPPQVQPPKEVFNDTEKLSLLSLEYNWSAADDPLRPVIITEMKKIKDGRELVEELKEIEIKMKLNNTISSLLELELSAPNVPLVTCELPLSHVPEQTSQNTTQAVAAAEEKADEIEEENTPQILEEEDVQLECTSEEEAAIQNEESEIHEDMHIVMQELDETGLPDPLDDMLVTDFLAIISHYMIPSLKVELNHNLIKPANAHSVTDNAYIQNGVSLNPHALLMLDNPCLDNGLSHSDNCFINYDTMGANTYHSHHVFYCYNYMIGYSIDDLVGVNPITFASSSLCEFIFRFSLVHHSLGPNMVRIDIPWDPGGFKAW